MALSATEAALERLQHQVHSGACGVGGASARLDSLLGALSRDETGRPFLSALPRVLVLLFGEPASLFPAWLSLARDPDAADAAFAVVRPSGSLFCAALQWSDGVGTYAYDVPVDAVPLADGKLLAGMRSPGGGVRVEAAELVLVRIFAWLVSLPALEGRAEEVNAALAERVLRAYVCFFWPCAAEGADGSAFSHSTLRASTGAWRCARLSALFSALVSGVLLAVPGDAPRSDAIGPRGLDAILDGRRTRLVQRAVRRVVGVTTGLSARPADVPAALRATFDSTVDGAYASVRPALYRFLRLAVSHLPSDGRAVAVCDALLEWAAPWRDEQTGPGDEWLPYVRSNYVFVHVLLSALVRDAAASAAGFAAAADAGRLDPVGSADAPAVGPDAVAAALGPHVYVLESVIATLAPFLRTLFWETEAAGSFGRTGTASAVQSGSGFASVLSSSRGGASLSAVPSLGSIGRGNPLAMSTGAIRDQLAALEPETFAMEMLFDSAGRARAAGLAASLTAVRSAVWPSDAAFAPATQTIGGVAVCVLAERLEALLRDVFRLADAEVASADESRRLDALSEAASHRRPRRGRTDAFLSSAAAQPADALAFKRKAARLAPPAVVRSYESRRLVALLSRLEMRLNVAWLRGLRGLQARGVLPAFAVRTLMAFRFRLRFLADYRNILLIVLCVLLLRLASRLRALF